MSVSSRTSATASPAYTYGGIAFLLALAIILGALAYEHIGGYAPCPLCLQQRWAYYAGVPLLFAALVLVSGDRGRPAALIFLFVALAFLANAGLGLYHAGAEWKWWPGPDTCGAAAGGLTTSAGKLLGELSKTRVVRCDEPALLVLGLSLAAWNVLVSLGVFTASLKAAFFSAERN
jgi:disulfide bond formation protein DsbB